MATDMLDLKGKVAIITGSGRENGIGAGIASVLARHGAWVTINYVSESTALRAANVLKTITNEGGKAIVVQADISTQEGANMIVRETLKAFGVDKIDILVNNAGTGTPGPSLQATRDSIEKTFAVNVFGPIFLIQAAVAHMPRGGRIINIGTIGSKLGVAAVPFYCASKAAMDSLTYSMAMELGRNHHITVNTVAPGPVNTDGLPPEQAAAINSMLVPMTRAEERVGTVEDIADAVLLLVSEKSRWITGQYISVSGGITGG